MNESLFELISRMYHEKEKLARALTRRIGPGQRNNLRGSSRFSGKTLREIRAKNGVGRPPR